MLEELDRLQLAATFAYNRLTKFYPRQQLQLDYVPNLKHKEIPTHDNFLVGDNNSDLSDVPNNFGFWDFASNLLKYVLRLLSCLLFFFSIREQHLSKRGRMWWDESYMS